MDKNFKKIIQGYKSFKKKYAHGNKSIMKYLSINGQQSETMVIACCDSRADPALILQCDPGDLFVVRNVANIVPPYEKDTMHHGTSAALEFGICYLKVKNLILLGHSQCGGIQALLSNHNLPQNDFITNWVSLINIPTCIGEKETNFDNYAKLVLQKSYRNCLTFPWINDKVISNDLTIHLWFFDIKTGQIFTYSPTHNQYQPLDAKSYKKIN
jgi:carbonic anhydrase